MASAGPPPVMMKMMSKTLNPPTSVRVSTIRNTGMICGSMMYQSRCGAFAPSIREASTSSMSTFRRADRKITITKPLHAQMAVASTAYRARSGSPSQPRARPPSPTASSARFSQP